MFALKRHVTVQQLMALRVNVTHSIHVRVHDTLAMTSNCSATPPNFASVYVLSTRQALLLGFAVALALLHTNCIRNDLRMPAIQLARGVWGSMPPDPPSEPDHFKTGGYGPVMPLLCWEIL